MFLHLLHKLKDNEYKRRVAKCNIFKNDPYLNNLKYYKKFVNGIFSFLKKLRIPECSLKFSKILFLYSCWNRHLKIQLKNISAYQEVISYSTCIFSCTYILRYDLFASIHKNKNIEFRLPPSNAKSSNSTTILFLLKIVYEQIKLLSYF